MKPILLTLMITIVSLMIVSEVFCTTTSIYGDGGFTDDQLTVIVFADIDADAEGVLCSATIKLSYPTDKLTNPVAVKNEVDWYMGQLNNKYPYTEPDTSTAGEVVILTGKLDSLSPDAGIAGNRIMLGSIRFDRILTAGLPAPGEFALTKGKEPPFDNFVTVTGKQLDDFVTYHPITIRSMDQINLEKVIRTLQVIVDQEPDIVVRVAEFDENGDGRVSLEEAISFLMEISH